MDFEWFESKRLRTLKERGLDFRDARHLFDGRPIYTYPSSREGEDRFVSVGLLEHRFVAVVWMERDGALRIISMRRARHGEERAYQALLG
ncbi:MAG TPA: BrnT family toxin [Stellaceae bacterium]|nr:BrnT family toxin [Stellaceae bacterium]